MPTDNPALEADEYLNVALEAIRQQDHRQAIVCLKEAGLAYPSDARLAYLLGAEYAQIGMPDRADQEMEKALVLNPALHAARFQLGLLRMTGGNPDLAKETWRELDVLPDKHAFRLFRDALEALAVNELQRALDFLNQGIVANDFSVDLNRDMVALKQRVEELVGSLPPVEEAVGSHVLLHGYHKPE